MKDTVSVLIPVYNMSKYLRECLDSVVNQTYKDLQIVIVDDGSTDDSLAIAREYEQKDKRVEVSHQRNAGVAEARNNLLSRIKGDYVLFVDSDDWIELNMIEFLIETLKKTNTDIVTCSMVREISNNSFNQEIWEHEKLVYEFLRHEHISGSLWNKLIKTRLLHNVKFHCGISYGEDALFFWQIIKTKVRVAVTDKQLYNYRRNPISISCQSWSPEKKGTGHIVWSSICEDVAKDWAKYLSIAKARFALEDMWGLYFASLAGYKYDEHIKLRQLNIKQNLHNIRKSRLTSLDRYITAAILCRWYDAGRIIKMIKG